MISFRVALHMRVMQSLSFFYLKVTERGSTWDKTQPRQPIEIYEFEGCPFCRKVREAVNILDLDVVFYPCPQGKPEVGDCPSFPHLPRISVLLF